MAVDIPTVDAASDEAADARAQAAQPWPKPAVAWYAVAVFAFVLMMGELDRNIIGLLVQPIKADLHLTDLQVSYLIGLAPVIFYAVIGIPLARLVDTMRRNVVLSAGVAVGSLTTVLCGLVQTFWQFFGCRIAVGGGGAINGPGTYSMMADFFPREKLPRAIAILQIGYISGGGMALVLGAFVIGAIAGIPPVHFLGLAIRNWQLVFIIVGLPGLIGALLLLTVPEPARRGRIMQGPRKAAPIGVIVGYLFKHWRVYGPMFLGLGFSAVETYGVASWRPTFFIRTYGWTAQQVGLTMGVVQIGFALVGLVFGTWLTEKLAKKHDDANMRVLAICYTMTPIFAIAGPLMPNPWLAVLFAGIGYLFGIAGAVPQNAALQSVTPNEMRGQVTALYLFVFTVIGLGLGPSFMAFITDVILHDESKIRYGLAGLGPDHEPDRGHPDLVGREGLRQGHRRDQSARSGGEGGLGRFQHHLRGALGDHHHRRVGVAADDAGHDRGIHHAQPPSAAHAQLLVDHGAARPRPSGRCRRGGRWCSPWRRDSGRGPRRCLTSGPGATSGPRTPSNAG